MAKTPIKIYAKNTRIHLVQRFYKQLKRFQLPASALIALLMLCKSSDIAISKRGKYRWHINTGWYYCEGMKIHISLDKVLHDTVRWVLLSLYGKKSMYKYNGRLFFVHNESP